VYVTASGQLIYSNAGSVTGNGYVELWVPGPIASGTYTCDIFLRNSCGELYRKGFNVIHINSNGREFSEEEINTVLKAEEKNILVYPNPGNDLFSIETGSDEPSYLNIMNISGQVVYQETLTQSKSSIDLSELPKGVYMIKISNEKSSTLRKLVIE
jgi:hypothetical protein